jgi:hypothetical protein
MIFRDFIVLNLKLIWFLLMEKTKNALKLRLKILQRLALTGVATDKA